MLTIENGRSGDALADLLQAVITGDAGAGRNAVSTLLRERRQILQDAEIAPMGRMSLADQLESFANAKTVKVGPFSAPELDAARADAIFDQFHAEIRQTRRRYSMIVQSAAALTMLAASGAGGYGAAVMALEPILSSAAGFDLGPMAGLLAAKIDRRAGGDRSGNDAPVNPSGDGGRVGGGDPAPVLGDGGVLATPPPEG